MVLGRLKSALLRQVMALNIGAALWIAAAGEGRLRCSASGPSGAADGLRYRSQVCARRRHALPQPTGMDHKAGIQHSAPL